MTYFRTFIPATAVALVLLLLNITCHASSRVALVIGNGDYSASPLKNPVNDATDIANLLEKLDFEVIKEINANKREMLAAVSRFSSKLKKSEIGIFYFAGHGMQINNRNYLIPVGVNVFEESDVEFEAVDTGRIISKMRIAESKLNVVILDACRNNPFKRSFRTTEQGLARMDAPKGTIVAYATSPGSIAADGKGRNGIFTKHLLDALVKTGLDVQDIFNEAGMKVMDETDDLQIPWTSNTPIPRFYLAGGNPDDVISDAPKNYKDELKLGSLKITSNPSGAQVKVNNRTAGETPIQLGNMVPGPVMVSVSRSGYKAKEQRVTVRASRRNVVNFTLRKERKSGWLTVRAIPQNAKVRILNINPPYSPGMELSAGRYHIEVSASGYEKETRWIDLTAGDDLTVDFSLEKKWAIVAAPKPQSYASQLQSSASPARSFTDSITGMEFVYVKGGCYQMGDTFGDGGSDEKPVHEVCVDGFYIGKYEVTQGEYKKITGSNPSSFKKGNNYPVENVSWNDAQKFITKLNSRSGNSYRLPTEAEWEYAARSGGKREMYSGSNSPDSVAWYSGNSGGSTHRVGTKSPNGLGLYDMSGNVWEWCPDWYGKNYYSSSPRNNPQGASFDSDRVIRGGSWDSGPGLVRSAGRDWRRPINRYDGLGFRLVFPEGS